MFSSPQSEEITSTASLWWCVPFIRWVVYVAMCGTWPSVNCQQVWTVTLLRHKVHVCGTSVSRLTTLAGGQHACAGSSGVHNAFYTDRSATQRILMSPDCRHIALPWPFLNKHCPWLCTNAGYIPSLDIALSGNIFYLDICYPSIFASRGYIPYRWIYHIPDICYS